ncbi:MAG: hypothetical protein HN337_03375 [Deltaproteobacteria bacterium]|jgi:hypothetical protein|nr:hypothetical protein [Deltaproteobacteria bacterium]
MLTPEIIDRLNKERDRQIPAMQELTLHLPEIIEYDTPAEDEEKRERSRVIVIDLL